MTDALVDDQAGINNYSGQCLNEAGSFTNHSAKWECGLSIDSPDIQAFLDRHKDLPDLPEDTEWTRCMSLDISTPPPSKPSCQAPSIGSFDLCDDDFDMEAIEEQPTVRTGSKTKFSFTRELEETFQVDKRPCNSTTRPVCPSNQSSSTNKPSSNLTPRSAFVDKVFGNKHKSSAAASKPSSSWRDAAQAQGKPSWSNNDQAPTTAPRNDFRTAGQQLSIDRSKAGAGGGHSGNNFGSGASNAISSASYGSGRKQLGVNGPPTSLKAAFKPPVRQSSTERRLQPPAANTRSVRRPPPLLWFRLIFRILRFDAGQVENDPRYKNIEPKMVELIMNEIMDAGQKVEWDDIAGLDFAKAAVKEIVIYPLLRPDLFKGWSFVIIQDY